MRMYASIKFDRVIIPEEHYISPGGYEMKAAGREYVFDFCEFTGNVDKADPTVLNCEMRTLDTYCYPKAKDFEKVCDQVEEISEFFVFTGEGDDPPIHPTQILSVSFWTDEFGLVSLSEKLFHNCLQD